MMVATTINGPSWRPTVYLAQLVGIGVVLQCESVLLGLHSHHRLRLLTHHAVDLHLVCKQWGAPLLVLAALLRIQSP